MKDYTLGETIDYKFTTCEPDTGAPITLAGTPVISAYVDNSTTQITAGITLTVDFDGVTGLHNVRVVATSGNGYAAGTNVALVITTGTVDGVSAVGYKVAEFTLGRPGTANVTQFNGTAATASGGRPEVNSTHWAGTAVGSTTVRADLINIAGAAVSTTTAQLGVNAVQISGDGTAADNLETAFDDTAGAVPWQLISDQGTLQSVTNTTTVVIRAAASAEDDVYFGHTIHFVSATTGAKQSALISGYVGSSKTVTLSQAVAVDLTGTVAYKIVATAPSTATTPPTAAAIADAVWDEAQADHVAAGSFGEVATETAAILVDTGTTLDARIPAALVSGRMDASVGAMAANVMTAAAAAADLTTELQSGLATAANLATLQTSVNTIDDLLDTEMPALTTAVADLPTNAELATALGTADDAVLAQVALVKAQTDKFANLPVLTAGGTGGQGYGAP